MTPAIALAGVRKQYDDFALHDIDLELPAGQVMGLVGVNGAGKSTLLRLLMGLVRADGGVVEVLGQRLPQAQVAVKREIGHASDDMRLYRGQSLRWHMDFIRGIYPVWDEAYAQDLLRRFDLRPQQALGGFSHGQRVKAVLLLIFARHPRLLLLDEPTTGLDPVARGEVLDALAEVLRDEERSILFSSHNTADIEQVADSITFLHGGRIAPRATRNRSSTAGGGPVPQHEQRCGPPLAGRRPVRDGAPLVEIKTALDDTTLPAPQAARLTVEKSS